MKAKVMFLFKEILPPAAAAILYAVGINMFLLPAGIVTGGASGIAMLLHLSLGLPTGAVILLINLPLLAVNRRVYGRRFVLRTLVTVAISSAAVDLFTFFPVTVSDPLLCAILGGAVMGMGIGIFFSRGCTTGGTDLAATLLCRRFPGISAPHLVLLCDAVVVLLSAAVLRDLNGLFYSVIAIGVTSFSISTVEAGILRSRVFFIVSRVPDEVAARLTDTISRGITQITCRGFYTGEERQLLMCAVRGSEAAGAKAAVLSVDPNAFLIETDAVRVTGEGFRSRAL